MLLLGIVLSAPLCAQNYSDDVTLVSQDENSITVKATAADDKKKDAEILAVKSAFNALLHSGVPEVKNGAPMFPNVASLKKVQSAYSYRLFSEGRYLNYIGGEVDVLDSEKFAGKQRVTVQVTLKTKALLSDLERNKLTISPAWADKKKVNEVAALNPTIVIVPYMNSSEGDSFEAMRKKIESRPSVRFVCDALAKGFQQNGYKTRDFIAMLQNNSVSNLLRADAQTDVATMIVQQMPGDIVVSAEVIFNGDGSNNECTITLRAVEKQTAGQLATESFASGLYMSNDTTKLATHALAKIQKSFFTQLNSSFEAMIQKGREVIVELNLSQALADWDFEQDSPATGDYFKDALEEWVRNTAFQDTYAMDLHTSKFVNFRIQVPLWDYEKNRSYTLTNFASEMRKFFKAQLGEDYKANTTAMGQKLNVIIE